MSDNKDSDAPIGALILIPLVVCTGIGLLIAWFAARAGARHSVIKAILFPFVFAISNALFFCLMIPVFFFIVLKNDLNVVGDLTLWNQFFFPALHSFWGLLLPLDPLGYTGQPTVNIGWVILYQVVGWFVFGRWILRNLALAFFDAATVKIAMAKGEDISQYRLYRAQHDSGYLKATLYYESRDATPPWSIVAVGIAGGYEAPAYYFGL